MTALSLWLRYSRERALQDILNRIEAEILITLLEDTAVDRARVRRPRRFRRPEADGELADVRRQRPFFRWRKSPGSPTRIGDALHQFFASLRNM